MRVFDYMFYRFVSIYDFFDGQGSATAIITVALAQSMLVLNPLGLYYLEYFNILEREAVSDETTLIVLGVMIPLLVYNLFRYRNKFEKFHERWKNENENRKALKFTFIVIFILCEIAFLPIMTMINDYTK